MNIKKNDSTITNVQIFNKVKIPQGLGQIVYIDDSAAQVKIDNKIFWISREELEELDSLTEKNS